MAPLTNPMPIHLLLPTQEKAVIFCGTGISFNSGIPVVPVFLKYLFDKIGITTGEAAAIDQSGLPFESIMETVLDEFAIVIGNYDIGRKIKIY